jgi:serine/threonine-protein kinase
MTGQLLGSPAYMAPELISGKPIDSRTDLFSVGIMLYQLSTGQLPFSGRNPHEVLNRIADADCAPPSSVNPMVDEDLEEILRRALSREPAHRYQTARALANDLEDYLQSMGVEAGPELLHAYFKNPEACVAELDARICAHLLDRAEKAQRDGHAARAIKQLARVLELDPQNARARTLIEQVRRRGRILRQSLMAASLLAGLGLVGAGALLMQEEPSPPGPGEVAAAKDAPPPRRARPAEPPREPDKKTPAVAGSGPVPEVEPGEPEAKGPREKEPRRPREPPRPAGKECRIEVKGIPAAQLRDYSLKLGDQKVTLDPDSSAAALDIPGGGGRFVLSGPRYELARDLSPEQCAGGTLTVQAEPRPATLDLRDVPPELETGEKLTIRCVSGCEFTGFYPELKKFRQKLPPGADNVAVVIALKAVGWTGDETRKLQLEPGPNSPKFWLRKLE